MRKWCDKEESRGRKGNCREEGGEMFGNRKGVNSERLGDLSVGKICWERGKM